MKRRILISLLALSLSLVAIAGAQRYRGSDHSRDAAPNFYGPTQRSTGFSISGHISGLLPGQRTPFEVAVTNPYRFPIDVTSISARAETGETGCSADNLVIHHFRGNLSIPGRDSRRLKLQATLLPDAPTACQGVTFPLDYSGTAVRP